MRTGPVMLACLLARMPAREFIRGNLPACFAWTATYQLIGLPWEGVAAAVALTFAVSLTPTVRRRLRTRRST